MEYEGSFSVPQGAVKDELVQQQNDDVARILPGCFPKARYGN